MRKPVLTAARTAAAVVLGLGALAACSADDPEPDPTESSTATPGPDGTEAPEDGWTVAEIEAAVLGPVEDEVLGSVDGAVPDRNGDHPARAEVTAVRATASTTVVWFTLSNPDDDSVSLPLDAFNDRVPLTKDIRDVALLDTASNLRLQPYVGVSDVDETRSFCTCAHAPKQITTKGQLLTATFPPLPEGTTTVALELPGFPLIEDLPVTRD